MVLSLWAAGLHPRLWWYGLLKYWVGRRLAQRYRDYVEDEGPAYFPQTEIIIYGPQGSPWVPLSLVVFLPLLVFTWGWFRKYWRQGILDLPVLGGQLWENYGPYGALLFLLPPLVIALTPWLSRLGTQLRQRKELHLFWLHIWAHGWAPYGRAHEFVEGPLMEWSYRHIFHPRGFLHGYAPLYRTLYHPRRILWGQLALALTELALSGGRLEWFLRALPALALVYGLARFLTWWNGPGLNYGSLLHHIVYDSPLAPERQVELAVFWDQLHGPLAPLLEPYAQSHPGQRYEDEDY